MSALGGAGFLGFLQGVTEFLPVSSSGHLVLFQQFFEVGDDEVLFDLVLHFGTLLPVLWFYRDTVKQLVSGPFLEEGPLRSRPSMHLWALLIAASVPTAVIGLALQDVFEALFATPVALVFTFFLTGVLLFSTRDRVDGVIEDEQISVKMALLLGVAQGFAITPGISRSGTTIAVAMMLGISRQASARFSFLMSVPAISGAILLKGRHADLGQLEVAPLLVGCVTSMITGYFALSLLVKLVQGGGFYRFAYYCWFAACFAAVMAVFV